MKQTILDKNLVEIKEEIDVSNPLKTHKLISESYSKVFLFESKDISHVYGRMSLIGFDPIVEVKGKENSLRILSLNKRGKEFLKLLPDEVFLDANHVERKEDEIILEISKGAEVISEENRSKRKSTLLILNKILRNRRIELQQVKMGFYGAFSYDVVRLVEDLPDQSRSEEAEDFHLFLYDSFILFDLLKEKTRLLFYRDSFDQAKAEIKNLMRLLKGGGVAEEEFRIKDVSFDYEQSEYEDLVEKAREYARKGEIFEVVFANGFKAKFEGSAFALYEKYRAINPSPYLFYFDFGGSYLVGASPEMMVRVENRKVDLRPISGTAIRGENPIDDHENMMELLSNKKERAELDMLVDLGRNDLSRICKPGVQVQDYRFIEKYSKVMHTVAHVTGTLREDLTALDALISCFNAGTLTGAPKVRAMEIIDEHEKEKRGYYGGTIGYLTLSGEMDTGIIIRAAHIKDGILKMKAGATLLYDSVPEKEYMETLNKARALLEALNLEVK